MFATSIKKRSLIPVALSFIGMVLIAGCTIAKVSGRGSIPMLLNNPAERVTVIEHFKISKMITFDYTSSFDVSEIIADKLGRSTEADAVTNISINVKQDVGTFLMTVCTFGLANAKRVEVQGDLVKLRDRSSSLLNNFDVLATFDTLDALQLTMDTAESIALVKLNDGFALIQEM